MTLADGKLKESSLVYLYIAEDLRTLGPMALGSDDYAA
jgi:hypothetical protein